MRIAVAGCCHGELEKVYGALGRLEAMGGFHIDLLLVCGNCQAARNQQDLLSMAVPKKLRRMGDFHKYYSGELKAPLLTLVVGGSREAAAYMNGLPFGGWLAPNIYYLGAAGCVQVGKLRIAGISGVYRARSYLKGRFEEVPYNRETVGSACHIRALDVSRLVALSDIDIVMSYDWPKGIIEFGDKAWLLRLEEQRFVTTLSGLGSRPMRRILDAIRPRYWFAAQLHVKFAAFIRHREAEETRFLALDTCAPHRDFLQVIEMPGKIGPLHYDVEWLCILRKTLSLETNSPCNSYALPSQDELTVTDDDRRTLLEDWQSDLQVPENFVQTAAPFHQFDELGTSATMNENPQTAAFIRKLGFRENKNNFTMKLEDFISPTPRMNVYEVLT